MITAIEFHKWMLKEDTAENAEKWFHYTDEDMFNAFIEEHKMTQKENKNSLRNFRRRRRNDT